MSGQTVADNDNDPETPRELRVFGVCDARDRMNATGRKLSMTARCVYFEICGFKQAVVSLRWLGEKLGGLRETAVRDAVVELEEAGLILRKARKGTTNRFLVLAPPPRENEGDPPRENEGDPPGNPDPKQEGKREGESEQLRPLVDNPPQEDPAREVAQGGTVPDNPRAPQGGSSSSTSARLSRFVGSREQDPPRGALFPGLRKAEPAAPLELPADLEAALVGRYGHDQVYKLRRKLVQGRWAGQTEAATMAARMLLERQARNLEAYVGQLFDDARERLTEPPPAAKGPPPPPTSDHPDDVQIATLKRRIRDNPTYRREQNDRELAELLERRAVRLGERAAS